MKSTGKNSSPIFKALAAIAISAILFASGPVSGFASMGKEGDKSTNNAPESTVNIKYVRTDEKMFEFKVEFENPAAQKFTLVVKNDDGEVIYSREFKDTHFVRTIRLVKERADIENIYPTFTISSGSSLIQRSFAIVK